MASLRLRKRKDGSVYTAVLFNHGGRQTSVSFDDHAEAVAFRDLTNRVGPAKALEVARVEQHQAAGMTVAHWLARHIAQLTGVERKTADEYQRYVTRDINPILGPIPLASLTRGDVAGWVNAMAAAGGSGKTIQNKHGFLSSALNEAVKQGKLASNPCTGQRLPRNQRGEIVFLTRQEFRTLHSKFSAHYKPLVQFLVASGARWGEATALTPKDVDRQASTVRITKSWKRIPGVGYELGAPITDKSTRTINVPASVLDQLDYTREWLFVNTAGDPVRIYGWRENVWYPAVKKAALGKAPRIHDLRHTCASWLILGGVPLPVVQQHLGHENITTTIGVYSHLDRASARAAAAVIGEALG